MPDATTPVAQALLLAAGRGERMRPLTDHCPKPLLPVRGRPLMQWTLMAMARGGIRQVLINTAWLEHRILEHFGPETVTMNDGALSISYSTEGRDFGGALETLGGIVRALPRLAPVFWVAAGDVYAPDFPFDPQAREHFAAGTDLAHLWLVPNPPQHPAGDFSLVGDRVCNDGAPRWTFSTIGLYRQELFRPPWCEIPPGNADGVRAPLAPLLRQAAKAGRVGGSLWTGTWADVGTPERLAALQASG